MAIHIHIHHHHRWDGAEMILNKLVHIQKTLKHMVTKEDFTAVMVEITDSLTNVADDITRLSETPTTGGLSEEDAEALFATLRTHADRLKSIAEITPEATEPTDEPVAEV